jgi:hypothetical protein
MQKTKRQKRIVTEAQQKVIVELHKTLPLKQIADQLKMRYDWAYQWAVANGLTLKYCRKVEPSKRIHVEVKGYVFDWEHYHNGESIVVGFQSKEDVLQDLKDPKDRAFLQKFPYFGKELKEYIPVAKRN